MGHLIELNKELRESGSVERQNWVETTLLRKPAQHLCPDIRVGKCIDMCGDICADRCVDMCAGMCVDMGVNMDTRADVFISIYTWDGYMRLPQQTR